MSDLSGNFQIMLLTFMRGRSINFLKGFINERTGEKIEGKVDKSELVNKINEIVTNSHRLIIWSKGHEITKFNNKKVLKQVHPDMRLNKYADQLMNVILTAIKVEYLELKSTGLTDEQVMDRLFPGELARHAKRNLSANHPTKQELKKVNDDKILFNVITYLGAEILELSGNAARDFKKRTVSPIHIELVLEIDEELQQLVNNLVV